MSVIIENKPRGMSSYIHRSNVKEKYKAHKIACTGRLDIMAEGKIKYLLNEECKNCDKYFGSLKTYEFTLVLGIETDSLDCLGLIKKIENKIIDNKKIYDTIYSFKKEYDQEYPIFSTYKIMYNNKKSRLIDLYLKNNIIPKDIGSKKVKIHNIKVIDEIKIINVLDEFHKCVNDFHDPYNLWRRNEILNDIEINNTGNKYQTIKLEAIVSSGTYVRQLCKDIGNELGTYGCCFNIKRTNIKEVS